MVIDKNLGRFIDNIRYLRNISRVDLVQDIVSLRQYKRYVSGEISIPNKVLYKLTDRLSISISELFRKYAYSFDKSEKWLEELVDLGHQNSKQFLKRLREERKLYSLSKNDDLYLNIIRIIVELRNRSIDQSEVIFEMNRLLDYEELIKQEVISLYELYGMVLLASAKAELGIFDESIEKLYQYTTHFEFSDKEANISSWILTRLGYLLQLKEDFEESIEICDEAIEFANKNGSIYNMMSNYTIKGYCWYQLGNVEEMNKSFELAVLYGTLGETEEEVNIRLRSIKDGTGWEPSENQSYIGKLEELIQKKDHTRM